MMRDQRNQGKNNEYKFWTKGVALLAAVTLLVTTLGSDMHSFGANYGGADGDNHTDIEVGGSFAQKITASTYEKLNNISFSLFNNMPSDAQNPSITVNYTVKLYENADNVDEIADNKKVGTDKTGSVTIATGGTKSSPETVSFAADDIYLIGGESLIAVVTITGTTDTATGKAYFCYSGSGSDAYMRYSEGQYWESVTGNVIALNTTGVSLDEVGSHLDTISLSVDKPNLKVGEVATLTPSYTPATRKRTVEYETGGTSGVFKDDDPTDNIIEGQTPGTATILAKVGELKKSSPVTINVYKPVLIKGDGSENTDTTVSFEYSGSAITPNAGFLCEGHTSTPIEAETKIYDFGAEPIDVGEHTVVFSSNSAGTFEGSRAYSIVPYDINQTSGLTVTSPIFENGDLKTATVTDGNGNVLTKGTDYNETTELYSTSTASSGQTTVTYRVTFAGIGNYSGTKVLDITDSATKTDIGRAFTATIDDSTLVYDGQSQATNITPVFTNRSGSTVSLAAGTNYTISFRDENGVVTNTPTNAGEWTAVITGTGSYYTGSTTVDFEIAPKPLDDAISEGIISVNFDGEPDEGTLSDLEAKNGNAAYYVNRAEKLPTRYGRNCVGPVVSLASTASGTALTEGEDYEVDYSNASQAPKTAKLTITSYGNVVGEVEYEYAVKYNFNTDIDITMTGGSSSTRVTTKPTGDGICETSFVYTYNGTDQKPTVSKVQLGKSVLRNNIDYEVIDGSNVQDAGNSSSAADKRPCIIIRGKTGSDYAGKEVKVYYTIDTIKLNSSNATLTVTTNGTLKYNGSDHNTWSDFTSFKLTVKNVGEYTVTDATSNTSNTAFAVDMGSFRNCKNKGTASVNAVGKNNFEGTVTGNFTIQALDITDSHISATIEGSATGIQYTGSQIRPRVTLSYDSTDLPSTDYVVTYGENRAAGTDAGSVTITGTGASGNLTGTLPITYFDINAKTISASGYTFKVEGFDCTPRGSSTIELETEYSGHYSGTSVRPTISVFEGTRALRLGTDYSLQYTNTTNTTGGSKSAKVTVIGKGGYGGSVNIWFAIEGASLGDGSLAPIDPQDTSWNRNISTGDVTVSAYTNVNYLHPAVQAGAYWVPDGDEVLAIKHDSYSLIEGMDYIVEYDIGDATAASKNEDTEDGKFASSSWKIARVKGIGNYSGYFYIKYKVGDDFNGSEKNATLKLQEMDGVSQNVRTGLYSVNYGLTPSPQVFYPHRTPSTELTNGPDYSIVYKYNGTDTVIDAVNLPTLPAGTKVDVNAIGNATNGKYYGTKTITYEVVRVSSNISFVDGETNIASNGSTVITKTYNGSNQATNITTTASSGSSIMIGRDYKIDGGSSQVSIGTNAGTEKRVVISFGENYSDNPIAVTYRIEPKSIQRVSVAPIGDKTYSGDPVTPKPTITDTERGGATLIEGTDYTLSYSNNTEVNQTATVTITGINNYSGTTTTTFDITKYDISGKLEIGAINDMTYDGTARTPVPSLKLNGEPLSRSDVDITYDDNTTPGEAKIHVKMHDATHYTDTTVTKTFKIIGDISTNMYRVTVNPETYYLRGGNLDTSVTASIDEYTTAGGPGKTGNTSIEFDIVDDDLKEMPGTRRVKVIAKGDFYKGTFTKDVQVKGFLSDAELTVPSYLPYKGTPYEASEISAPLTYNGHDLSGLATTRTVSAQTGAAIIGEPGITYTVTTNDSSFAGNNNPLDKTISKTIPIYYDLSNATVTLNPQTFAYKKGEACEPDVTVTILNGTVTLTKGTDYTVSYLDNDRAGTATAVISPVSGRSKGDRKKYFTIDTVDGTNFVLSGINSTYTYTGYTIQPEPVVNVPGVSRPLEKDIDYKLTYTGSTKDAGDGSVTVTGVNNYSGSKSQTYSIEKKVIGNGSTNDSEITVLDSSTVVDYAGNKTLPDLVITYLSANAPAGSGGVQLAKGTDYVLEWVSGTGKIGQNRVRINSDDANNYSGKFEINYTVNRKNISDFNVDLNGMDLIREYDGSTTTASDIRDNLKITYPNVYGEDGRELVLNEGTDYDITFAQNNMTEKGKYAITITGKGNYDGRIDREYEITDRLISNPEIEYTYTANLAYNNGNTVELTDLRLQDKGVDGAPILRKGVDYTVEYNGNNTTSGDHKVALVKGIGTYAGQKEIEYSIGDNIADFSLDYTKSFSYTGHEQKPLRVNVQTTHDSTVSLTRDNPSKTVNGATFTLAYTTPGSTDAGTYDITVTATGGRYYGTKTAQYTINPVSVSASNLDVQFAPSELERKDANGHYNYPFTGSEICPPVVVKYIPNGGTPMNLTEGEDYDVIYKNNINVGGPIPITVQLAPNRNFSNSPKKSISFYITGIDTEAAGRIELYNGDDYDYTGSAIKPYISKIYDSDGNELYDGEYKILSTTYENNVNPGEATMKVTLGGNYSGTITKTFRIIAPVTSANIDAIPDQFYTGAKQEPKLRVHIGTIVLEQGEGKDYTVEYTSPDNWENNGLATVTLNPEGQYYDYIREDETPLQKTFKIVKDASALKPTIADSFTYTGYPIKPLEEKADAISMPDGTKITYDKNGGDHTYTITGYQRYDESTKKYAATTDHTNAGKIRATIKMKIGDTTVDKEVDYEILRRAITSTNISTLRNEVYTASAKTPSVYINYTYKDPNDNALTKTYTLVKDKDYSVAYKDNTNPGTAQVIITGLGNFTGTDTEQFKITVPDVTGLKSSGSQTSVTLSWNKNNRITGYKIYSSDGKTYYGQTEGTSFTKNNLQAGRDYSFGVIPYVTAGGKTTNGNMATLASSTVVSVPVVTPGTNAQGVNGAALSFGTVNGVNYKIFRANSANGTYKQIATVPGSMAGYTDRNVTSGRVYYYKIQAVKILADGTVIKSEMSTPVAVTAK